MTTVKTSASKEGETKSDEPDNTSQHPQLSESTKKPLRFVIVGVANTLIDFGLMNIFKLIGLNIYLANTLSTGTAMIFSFFLNKKWTFRNAGQDYLRQVVLFFVFTMIGIWGNSEWFHLAHSDVYPPALVYRMFCLITPPS